MSRARDRADGVLHNRTHEDTEGGRESLITFKGEQSGGEISTLAQIQASHDGTSDDEKADLIFKTNDGSDGASPTEAARIDSDQNLLVSKTSAGAATAGFETRSSGYTAITRDGGQPLEVRRLTGDGVLIDLRKDSTSVGSIAARGGHLRIGNDDIGLEFHNTNNAIYPANITAATLPDNTTDLGASNIRFKDIYTSGGIYLGAASAASPVAANHLDDYEEGTFSGRLSSGYTGSVTHFTSATTGYYIKIGRLVHWQIHHTEQASGGSSAQTVYLTGLPFNTAQYGALSYWLYSGFSNIGAGQVPMPRYQINSDAVVFQKFKDGTSSEITYSNFGGTMNIMLTGTYYTSS